MNAFIWAVLAALVWGVVPIFEKVGLRQTMPLAGLFYRSVGVMVGMLLLGFFMVKPQEIRSVDIRSALCLMAGGFLASFIAQIFFYNSLKVGEVSRIVPLAGSYPLIAFLLGVLLLGESVTPFKMVGVLLVLSGVWFLKLG